MPITVNVKGQTLSFPDGTPDDVIHASVMRDFFGQGGDVRSQIAARQANAPAAAKGDPNAPSNSTLETVFPAAAHPLDAAAGFLGSINPLPALAHPVDAIKSDASQRYDALQRMEKRGLASDDPEQLRDLATYILPFFGPAMANAGRQMNSTDPSERAKGFGGAVGATSGPKIVGALSDAAAPVLENSAIKGYGKIFGKKADPQMVADVVPTLIKDRVRVANPRTDLVDTAEARATAGNKQVDAAIAKSPPVNVDAVNQSLEAQKTKLSNPFGPDSQAAIDAIDKYKNGVIPMNAVGDVATKTDVIPPQGARSLKATFDPKFYDAGSTTADAMGRKAAGDALRGELNKDPGVASANAEVNKWLKVKELGQSAPEPRPVMSPFEATRASIGVGSQMFGHGGAGLALEASAAIPIVYRFMTSPRWRTTSAIIKSQMADAIKTGNMDAAAEIATRASQPEDTRDQYLQRLMAGAQ